MKPNAILLICAVIIASGLVWYSANNTSGTVPIIRADNSPIKERPNERGGMNIAHKDSTIYNTMRGSAEQGRVENLLAERPAQGSVNRDELFAGIKAQQIKKQQAAAVIEPKEIKATETESASQVMSSNNTVPLSPALEEQSTTTPPEPSSALEIVKTEKHTTVNVTTPKARPRNALTATAKSSTTTPADTKQLSSLLAEVQGLKIDPIQKKKAQPANAPSITQATHSAGSHYIQIGSLRSESAAKAHWAARSKEFAATLKGFSLRIEHIEIAERGSFYRVQGGAVSKETAKKACAVINARHSNSCIVK
jgi:hypothetical protein